MTTVKNREIFSYEWKTVENVDQLIKEAESGLQALRLELAHGDLIGLSTEDINLFSDNVNSLHSVKALCLVNCGFTNEDYQLIFASLKEMTNLEFLDLSSNLLETEGTKMLAEYIRQSVVLKSLNISNCQITSTGLTYLIDEIENNLTLRSLILDDNPDLSNNAIISLYEAVRKKKNIVQFSTLSTYCDVKSISEIFKILRRHNNILFVGFPKFYQRKKNFADSLLDSQDSLLEVRKEDLLNFRDVTVQKALFESLKSNFSLVRVFNKHVKPDVRNLLKRNLSLMKNEFNNILHQGEIISSEFCHETLLVLGRRGSGKTQLLENLFGSTNFEEYEDFELRIREKHVTLQRAEGMTLKVSQPRSDECRDFSFAIASKVLARRSRDHKKNEKFMKLSQVLDDNQSRRPDRRKNRRRQQLSFYRYPEGQKRPQRNMVPQRSQNSQPIGNSLLHSYRNRNKRKNSNRKKSSRSSYQLDQVPSPKKRVSFDRADPSQKKSKEMRPNMRKSEIVDYFDPKVIAAFGNIEEKPKVFLTILEVSPRVSNSISSGSKDKERRGTLSSTMATNFGDDFAKKKLSETEKFGTLNKSLIDLNHLCFGIESENGAVVLTFSIPKLLKYIQVEEERMILHNPITSFLKHNVRIAFSKSKELALFLVGTGYNEGEMSEKALDALHLMIKNNLTTKDFKRLIRFKSGQKMFCFHPVNTFDKKNTSEFKSILFRKIHKISKNRAKDKLAIKYIRAYDILKNEGVPFMSKQDILGLVEEANIKEEEIDDLICFLRENNMVLHFPNIGILDNFVIIDKIYFYQLMYQFVNRRYITKILNLKEIKEAAKVNDLNITKDIMLFKSKRLVSYDLIEFVWSSNPVFDQPLSRNTYLYLTEIMKKSLFLTPWQNIRYNIPPLSELAAPITSENIQEFTAENIFLLTPCIKRTSRNQTKTRLRNVRSFAETASSKSRSRSESRKSLDERVMKKKESEFSNPPRGVRSRGGGSFEGMVFSSRAKRAGSRIRGRLMSKDSEKNDRARARRSKKRIKGQKTKSGKGFVTIEPENNGLRRKRSSKKVIAVNARPNSGRMKKGVDANLNKEKAYQLTLEKAMRGKTKTRYLLDKNKPVSIIIDFQTSFLPTGLFFRLSSALYSLVIDAIRNERRGFKKGIETVELYQNLFRIRFDRAMISPEEDFSEFSTHGTPSVCDSEVEDVSVTGAKKMGESFDPKLEEKEYIALYHDERKASIIMIVRDHDIAPRYLGLLDKSLEMILPRKEEEEINEFMTMFYNVQMSKRMVKVEVKNNKFITLEVAEKRKFAPWFAKNKRIPSS